jgi:hypothetical protein
MDAIDPLLIDHSTRAGILPDRVATDSVRCPRGPIVMAAG